MYVCVCAQIMEEESVWEAQFLKVYCNSTASLEHLSYALHSVLACTWFVAKSSKDASRLCGESPIDQANVRQWLDYYATKIRTENKWDTLSRDQLHTVLQELNRILMSKVYLVNNRLSLADIILYYGLHRYMLTMTFSQKAEFVHVSRWFDQVQHCCGVRPTLWAEVVFHKKPELL